MSKLKTWHWSRWLRTAIAGAFIAQGFVSGDGLAYAIGAFFGIQAIFNVGCFAVGTCAPAIQNTTSKDKDITYQKIG